MEQIKAEYYGEIAREFLQPAANFSITGTSSRGLFMIAENDWVIFLSWEPFRGPMTINLAGRIKILNSVSQGDPALVDGVRLVFPRRGISIDLAEARMWAPSSPPAPTNATDRRTIQSLLSPLGDDFLNTIVTPQIQNENYLSRTETLAFEITKDLQAGALDTVSASAHLLLGLGTGLTPEGDDFIIGLCFSLARSSRGEVWHGVTKGIIETAYQRTTRLSANLIEAAGSGLADERLVAAHDAMYRGDTNAEEAFRDLLDWGSTSGRMALAGIAAGILTRQ